MNFTVVILSGGKSQRMGSDKGSLVLNGKAFVDVLADNMSRADEILLSTGENDVYSNVNVRHIHDEYKECGPMGGIHKALKVLSGEWLFAVACDMPEMDYTFAYEILEQGLKLNKDARVIVPVDEDGRRHMTAAFYHRSLLVGITGLLEAGNRKLQSVAEMFPAVFVPVFGKINIRKLMNINTVESYKALVKRHAIPVIAFVGYSESGKTTLVERIVRELYRQEVKTAYIKHTHHEVDISGKNKDNGRIFEAGADISIVVSNDSMEWLDRRKPDIDEIIARIDDVDLIIIEGYKNRNFDKILVTSTEDESKWAIDSKQARLLVGPSGDKPFDYSRDDVSGICRWLLKEVIKNGEE